jgi:hypothetical protein
MSFNSSLTPQASAGEYQSVLSSLRIQVTRRPWPAILKSYGLPANTKLEYAASIIANRAVANRSAIDAAESERLVEAYIGQHGRHVCESRDGSCTKKGIHVIPKADAFAPDPLDHAKFAYGQNRNPKWKNQLCHSRMTDTKARDRTARTQEAAQ